MHVSELVCTSTIRFFDEVSSACSFSKGSYSDRHYVFGGQSISSILLLRNIFPSSQIPLSHKPCWEVRWLAGRASVSWPLVPAGITAARVATQQIGRTADYLSRAINRQATFSHHLHSQTATIVWIGLVKPLLRSSRPKYHGNTLSHRGSRAGCLASSSRGKATRWISPSSARWTHSIGSWTWEPL